MNNFFCNKCLGEEVVAAASSLSIVISKDLTLEELETLSTFLTVLGDCLDAIATQRAIYKELCPPPATSTPTDPLNTKLGL